MDTRNFLKGLGFVPVDGTSGIFHKVYYNFDDYAIVIDFDKRQINYGDRILAESRTTQNFSQPENFVVLECVDRLLLKGYKPENIVLEKTWPSGHGTSGRLDICVNRDDGTPYLLIECKTYGKEFEKELSNIHKNGGQLFTYFQLSGCKADVLMLYASEMKDRKVIYRNEIVKVEDEYRNGEVKDIFEKWNKLTKDNGVFDSWVNPYNFQSKSLTIEQLKEIKPEDSSFIFNRFEEILRHNVVSDKGNAFNKIFTLFLCKVYDETRAKAGKELDFQWKEGIDDHVSFQLRLTDLYSKGMKQFLERTVSDFNEEDFENRCADLTPDTKRFLQQEVVKLRLEKNNEFAIKEVYDHDSFVENAKVVKEVVELLQGYRIRYNKRQQYLSDFFELLLTTGLKQESGQFFTPVPVARFVVKSLPLDDIVSQKLKQEDGNILPYAIDYAAGSGHFITEYMHEVQSLLNVCDESNYIDETKTDIETWRRDHYKWATKYVYGVEKDYRLVKVGKVGCYLHGDGLANVILSDGLSNFHKNKDYKAKLHKNNDDGQRDNQQFDILLSNPPYSVPSFRQTTRDYYTERDFELYNALTDNSSEIECLFVERAKHLLKDGGVAGIILPSSILSNSGIYAKTREIILRFFDIVAVVELGGNTFMATSTNTVVLFLRRRNNYFAANTKTAVDLFFRSLNDLTINGIEKPAAKYVAQVWEGLDYADYITLLQKLPNEKVKAHEIFKEYKQKISANSDEKFYECLLAIEAEKMLYFVLAYPQQVVIVKSGEKTVEKQFLGYEFSNRRGNEGIHSIQRGKDIDECTELFDPETFDNPDKASTYIYRAFKGDFTSEISETMKPHVFRQRLVDMIAFDRGNFEKNVSTAIKKKVNYKWPQVKLKDIANIQAGNSAPQNKSLFENGRYPFFRVSDVAKTHLTSSLTVAADCLNEEGIKGLKLFEKGTILFPKSGASTYLDHRAMMGVDGYIVSHLAGISVSTDNVIPKFLYEILTLVKARDIKQGSGYPSLNESDLGGISIPLPPKEIQERIVTEMEIIDDEVSAAKNRIAEMEMEMEHLLSSAPGKTVTLKDVALFVTSSVKLQDIPIENYVTTDNMLQNKQGVVPFKGTPNIETITTYQENDILVSNIRPYLKKIWLADKKGGCSKDVLVLRSSDETQFLAKYMYYMLSRDVFFDYVMEGKKGVKMPRGNKEEIMKYGIPMPSANEQKKIVLMIEELKNKEVESRNVISKSQTQKQVVLEKYLR